MKLLEALAAGVRGAENGTVEIYQRGTVTFAQIFTDYDGSGATTPTAGIALDSYGAVVRYVNQSVLCVVKSSSGATVRTFTVMDATTAVEANSQSFTGTAYVGGATGPSKPVPVSTILDLWRTNAGNTAAAIDWKVIVGGTAKTLATAFSEVSGLFFNVKSQAYGATGDGATDDTAAIQAAIDAADNFPGGIVYFPGGNYRITSALNVKANVSMMGAGARAVSILIDHATNNAISFAASGGNEPQFLRGLEIMPMQSNSGKMVVVESGSIVNIEGCTIGQALLTGKGLAFGNAATDVRCYGCNFIVNSATGYHVYGQTGYVTLIGCKFVWSATNMTAACVYSERGAAVLGCTFDLSAVSNAAANGHVLDICSVANSPNFVAASKIVAPSVGTNIVANFQTAVGQGTFDMGFAVPSNVLAKALKGNAGAVAAHEGIVDLGRDTRRDYSTDNGATKTVDPDLYGVIEVRRTNNGNQTLTFGSNAPTAGMMASLVYNNDHGAGGGTITMAGFVKGLASFTVNANCMSIYTFRSFESVAAGAGSANTYWGLVGSVTNVAP